jgi:hypothetical protein
MKIEICLLDGIDWYWDAYRVCCESDHDGNLQFRALDSDLRYTWVPLKDVAFHLEVHRDAE